MSSRSGTLSDQVSVALMLASKDAKRCDLWSLVRGQARSLVGALARSLVSPTKRNAPAQQLPLQAAMGALCLPARLPPPGASLPERAFVFSCLSCLGCLKKHLKNTAGVRVLSVRMVYTHLLPSSQDPIFGSSTIKPAIWRESGDLTRQTVSVRRARGQEVAGSSADPERG